MKIRAILCSAVAAQLIFAGNVAASARETGEAVQLAAFGIGHIDQRIPAPEMRVPGSRNDGRAYVQLAQAGDPRVIELEEQVRQLNGLVEELNFQVLQMQDQIRKMQEDNEFRFQQLEGSGDGVMEPRAGTNKKTDAARLARQRA
jgi:TolA-binding protein